MDSGFPVSTFGIGKGAASPLFGFSGGAAVFAPGAGTVASAWITPSGGSRFGG
jgi:hypothetical protein